MEILGLEKLSLVDYDGYVSATVFTGACNFRCGFCHNGSLVLDYKNIPVIPTEEVLSYLKKRSGIIEGLCISGGEPTLQKDLPDFIEKVKSIGLKVKVDTNGTNPEMIKLLAENGLVDYFAMDIKNDLASYGEIIGIENFDTKNIEKSVEYFLSGRIPYEFRTTLIKEYHTAENIINIGKWIKGANKYFLQKFKDCEGCIQSHLSAVEDKIALEFTELLKEYIPSVRLRGYDI